MLRLLCNVSATQMDRASLPMQINLNNLQLFQFVLLHTQIAVKGHQFLYSRNIVPVHISETKLRNIPLTIGAESGGGAGGRPPLQ